MFLVVDFAALVTMTPAFVVKYDTPYHLSIVLLLLSAMYLITKCEAWVVVTSCFSTQEITLNVKMCQYEVCRVFVKFESRVASLYLLCLDTKQKFYKLSSLYLGTSLKPTCRQNRDAHQQSSNSYSW